MLADLGFFLLFLCCITSIYGVGTAIAAALMRHRRLYRSSRLAGTAIFGHPSGPTEGTRELLRLAGG